MRKKLDITEGIFPMPVLMVATYNDDGSVNVMNAAWGGIYDYNKIHIALSKHKTTANLELKKAFTVSFATKDTEEISDYFGIVSGNHEDKIKKTQVHVTKSNFVDAPIIEEYPLTLECKVDSFIDGTLIGTVVNTSVDEKYLDEKLLPFVKKGGYIYIVVPGMKKDCHNNIHKELLLSWTPEQLDYIHDIEYWKNIISKSKKSEIISIYEMESNEECWNDWVNCDNEYSKNDKKAIDAGACKYLNFIAIVLKKK